MQPHKLLVISRHSPYGSQQARAALDMALTAAAFELDVSMVFTHQGLYQLLDAQETDGANLKNVGKLITALALYDVKRVYVHAPSMRALELDAGAMLVEVEPLEDSALAALVDAADQVMVF